ncbi:cytochrome P450 [Canariomyces notabilis]|uniref:Cytochrome P450 n=1 Tax=Canariomyces notabilis TaxID=2074819 RepID=A0AAN6T9Y2_9PEZI|nr:cytochrome P450 [Canariomyces arenarius]
MPEFVEPLRSEAQVALAQTNGEWQFSTTKKLARLDSFLKESQRLNQSTFLGFHRKVMSPIKLSDNTTILHPGITISMPGYAMARDSAFYGDDDPLRFNRLRFYLPYKEEDDISTTSSTDHARHLDYTGIEPGNISWGSGRFTCPGRWYAAAMIKLILASLLLDYDVSFPPGQTERPQNVKYDTELLPDFGQRIVLRKRRVA